MKDPCKSLVKEANKKTRKISLEKDFWSGALLYIQASECYRANMQYDEAFKLAMKAVENLKKYASKYGYELVIGDIEKALLLAYSVAPQNKKDTVKIEIFNTMNLHAKQLELSGNQIQAADIYQKSIEFAPSGEEAKRVLLHAISILETAAQQKLLQGKDKLAEKLTSKAEELRLLIPEETPLQQKSMVEKRVNTTEEMSKTDLEPAETVTRIRVYESEYPAEKVLKTITDKIMPTLKEIADMKVTQKEYGYVIEINLMGPRTEITIEIDPPLITITSTGTDQEILDTYEKAIVDKLEALLPKIKVVKETEI